jgi:hypothetical protein
MTTKQQLKLAWDKLNALAKDFSAHTADSLTLELVEIEQMVAEARRLVQTGGFGPVYAVGIEVTPGEYGMMHGPTPNLQEMLSVIPVGPHNEKFCLFRFENHEPVLTHRWSIQKDGWEATSQ